MARFYAAVAMVFLILAFLPYYAYNHYHRSVKTLQVVKAERVIDSYGKGGKYLVFTPTETYEDVDSLFNLKFNSSDVYGGLATGHSYNCLVYGARIPLLSIYPNIVNCTEVKRG